MDVPAETALRWQSREVYKLRKIVEQKKRVIEKLRKNLNIVLKSPEARKEISREIIIRERNHQIKALQKELHRVREADRKILETLLKYKLKEQNGQKSV